MAWQQASGYNKRARSRRRSVMGFAHARTHEGRVTEVDLAVHALIRMLELGRPNYVRVVWPQAGIGSLRAHP
jgi:hypothetical protein